MSNYIKICRGIVALIVIVLCAISTDAWAEEVEGTIIQVSQQEVIVDLGHRQGVPKGATLKVFRRLEVRHPVSGEAIVDRFPIGALPLEQVGELLSIATERGGLQRMPSVGDHVIYEIADPTKEPPPEAAEVVAVGRTLEEQSLNKIFHDGLGTPLKYRVVLYEEHLLAFPEGAHNKKVIAELQTLYRFNENLKTLEAELVERSAAVPDTFSLTTKVVGPLHATTDDVILFDVSVRERAQVALVRLIIKRPNLEMLETLEMLPNGDFNWSVALPDDWRSEGEFRWFTEIVLTDGSLHRGGGDARGIRTFTLTEIVPDVPDQRRRSTLHTEFAYVDFWYEGNSDAYFRFDTNIRYLVDWGIVRAFRMGFGVFQGEGGSVEELEEGGEDGEGGEGRERNVNYGYSELEFAFHDLAGIALRLSIGGHHETAEGTAEGLFGFSGDLRIGREDGTRLLLGGAFTQQLGNEGWLHLVLEEVERVPMDLGVVVTNLPVDADLGVSLFYGAGFRINNFIAIHARVGWNARTINHFGFTGGGSTVLTW